jgi:AcrR family transcriptional regulator
MPYSSQHNKQRKNETHARILQSAEELFCRYGFNNISIQDIMQHARMTHGAFYAHFKSKEALFSQSILDSFHNKRYVKLSTGRFSIRHLTGIVADYLSLKTLNEQISPSPASILINEINNDRPEITRLYEEAYTRVKRLITKRITAMTRMNKIPFPADTALIEDKSRAVLSTLVGAIAMARNLSSEQEQVGLLRSAQRQIIAMLGLQESEFELV